MPPHPGQPDNINDSHILRKVKQILRKAKQATDSNKEEHGQDGEIRLYVHEAGERCAPEPTDHIIWDGVIALNVGNPIRGAPTTSRRCSLQRPSFEDRSRCLGWQPNVRVDQARGYIQPSI